MKCQYAEMCSGCDSIGISKTEQRQKQAAPLFDLITDFESEALKNLTPKTVTAKTVRWRGIAESGLRDRVDLIYTETEAGVKGSALGLYHKNKKEIVDLELCPQMSPSLSAFYLEVRQIKFPIRKGSLRLRVGPHGIKGIWLDFANTDIKALIDDGKILKRLREIADVIEIGQKKKIWNQDTGKLGDPEPDIWFQTSDGETLFPLYCHVASFTQPSLRANEVLVSEVLEFVEKAGVKSVFEFGSGIGNFTLPLLNRGLRVTALEFDSSAIELLKFNIAQSFGAEIQKNAEFQLGNFHKEGQIDFTKCDGLVLDPPRSGIGDFLLSLHTQTNSQLRAIVYVSCFPESFQRDALVLKRLGFRLEELSFVDQFPQTSHVEVVSLWLKK